MSKRYELELPVVLSDTEIVRKGNMLSLAVLKSIGFMADIDAIKADTKERIKKLQEERLGLQKQIRDLARSIRRKEEFATVSVEARVTEDNSKVDIVRLDTGVVVETRALTEEDRQMQIEDVLEKIEYDTKSAEREEVDDDALLEDSEEPSDEDDGL